MGLYYLKSRFYNPVTGRFISPDDTKYLQPDTINGLNLFAYCGNNPVMNIDPNGNAWWDPRDWNWDAIGKIATGIGIVTGATILSIATGGAASVIFAGAAIGSATGFVSSGVSALVSGGGLNSFANGALMGAITGAISGAVAASPLGGGGQMVANSVLNVVNYAGNQFLNGKNPTFGGIAFNAVTGLVSGKFGGAGWLNSTSLNVITSKNIIKLIYLPLLSGIIGGLYDVFSEHVNHKREFLGF